MVTNLRTRIVIMTTIISLNPHKILRNHDHAQMSPFVNISVSFVYHSGMVSSATFLLAAGYSGCDRRLAVTSFCLTMGLSAFIVSGQCCNHFDLSPNYAGGFRFCASLQSAPGALRPFYHCKKRKKSSLSTSNQSLHLNIYIKRQENSVWSLRTRQA